MASNLAKYGAATVLGGGVGFAIYRYSTGGDGSKKLSREEAEAHADPRVRLAQCLSDKGVKLYGTSWCGWCKKQREVCVCVVNVCFGMFLCVVYGSLVMAVDRKEFIYLCASPLPGLVYSILYIHLYIYIHTEVHTPHPTQAFGPEGQHLIEYVDCSLPDGKHGFKPECIQLGIRLVPSWSLPDGTVLQGTQPFEKLAQVAKCDVGGQ